MYIVSYHWNQNWDTLFLDYFNFEQLLSRGLCVALLNGLTIKIMFFSYIIPLSILVGEQGKRGWYGVRTMRLVPITGSLATEDPSNFQSLAIWCFMLYCPLHLAYNQEVQMSDKENRALTLKRNSWAPPLQVSQSLLVLDGPISCPISYTLSIWTFKK